MQGRDFSMRGSIIFAGCAALGLAAFANTSLAAQNGILAAAPGFQASTATHETRADSQAALQYPNASEVAAGTEAVSSAPPTRSSFMATWGSVTNTTGYLLDVSTSSSFSSYVEGYHDLDVGNVTGRVVTE